MYNSILYSLPVNSPPMTGFLPSKTIQMQHLEVPNKKKPSPQPSLPIDINKTIGLFLNIGVVMAGDILFTIFLWL